MLKRSVSGRIRVADRVVNVGIPLNFNRKILLVMCLVLLSTVVLEIWISSRISTFGAKIYQLNQEESNLQLENQLLQDEIAASSSLSQISKASGLLGLGEIKSLEYIEPLGLAYK